MTDTPAGIHEWRFGNADTLQNADAGLVLGGGGTTPQAAMNWFADRANGGDIVLLAITSDADDSEVQRWINLIPQVNSVTLISFEFYPNIGELPGGVQAQATASNALAQAAASSTHVQDLLNQAEGIFMMGGDQWGYISCWNDTPVESILEDRFQNNEIVLGGTSAGLAVLGEYDFTSENGTVDSREALQNANGPKITVSDAFLDDIDPLEGVITDTHFAERDRMGRLITFLTKMPIANPKAIAVNEGTTVLLATENQTDNLGDATQDFGLLAGEARVVGGTVYFLATDEAILGSSTPLYYRRIRVRSVSDADGEFVFENMWNKNTAVGTQYYIDATGGYLFSDRSNNNIYY